MIKFLYKTLLISLISGALSIMHLVAYAGDAASNPLTSAISSSAAGSETKATDAANTTSYDFKGTKSNAGTFNAENLLNTITMLAIGVVGAKLLMYKKWTLDMKIAAVGCVAYIAAEVMTILALKKQVSDSNLQITKRPDGTVDQAQIDAFTKLEDSYKKVKKSGKIKIMIQQGAAAAFAAATLMATFDLVMEQTKTVTCEAAISTALSGMYSAMTAAASNPGTAAASKALMACSKDLTPLPAMIAKYNTQREVPGPSEAKLSKSQPDLAKMSKIILNPCMPPATALKAPVIPACTAYTTEVAKNNGAGSQTEGEKADVADGQSEGTQAKTDPAAKVDGTPNSTADGVSNGTQDGLTQSNPTADGVSNGTQDGFTQSNPTADGVSNGTQDGFTQSNPTADGVSNGTQDGFTQTNPTTDGVSNGTQDSLSQPMSDDLAGTHAPSSTYDNSASSFSQGKANFSTIQDVPNGAYTTGPAGSDNLYPVFNNGGATGNFMQNPIDGVKYIGPAPLWEGPIHPQLRIITPFRPFIIPTKKNFHRHEKNQMGNSYLEKLLFANANKVQEADTRKTLQKMVDMIFPQAEAAGMMSGFALGAGAMIAFALAQSAIGKAMDEYIFSPLGRIIIWAAFAAAAFMSSKATESEMKKVDENIIKIEGILAGLTAGNSNGILIGYSKAAVPDSATSNNTTPTANKAVPKLLSNQFTTTPEAPVPAPTPLPATCKNGVVSGNSFSVTCTDKDGNSSTHNAQWDTEKQACGYKDAGVFNEVPCPPTINKSSTFNTLKMRTKNFFHSIFDTLFSKAAAAGLKTSAPDNSFANNSLESVSLNGITTDCLLGRINNCTSLLNIPIMKGYAKLPDLIKDVDQEVSMLGNGLSGTNIISSATLTTAMELGNRQAAITKMTDSLKEKVNDHLAKKHKPKIDFVSEEKKVFDKMKNHTKEAFSSKGVPLNSFFGTSTLSDVDIPSLPATKTTKDLPSPNEKGPDINSTEKSGRSTSSIDDETTGGPANLPNNRGDQKGDFNYGTNDIHTDKSSSIFQIISNRYRQSGHLQAPVDEKPIEKEK